MKKTIKQRFDEKIKELQEQSDRTYKFGYGIYDVYFEPKYKDFLIDKMKEDRAAYDKGAGGELKEHKRNDKTYPPSMLSVASSSRFCFLSLKGLDKKSSLKAFHIDENVEIEFEKKLKIFSNQKGTPPHIDAYCETNDCNIYFECKCHEMFDHHNIELSTNYFKGDLLCSQIEKYHKSPNEVEEKLKTYKTENGDKQSYVNVIKPSYFGIKNTPLVFDVKQLLTHLMGIKENKNPLKKARLIYFYFIPDVKYEESIENVINSLYSQAEVIFHHPLIQNFTNENHIEIELWVQTSTVVEAATTENTKMRIPTLL